MELPTSPTSEEAQIASSAICILHSPFGKLLTAALDVAWSHIGVRAIPSTLTPITDGKIWSTLVHYSEDHRKSTERGLRVIPLYQGLTDVQALAAIQLSNLLKS